LTKQEKGAGAMNRFDGHFPERHASDRELAWLMVRHVSDVLGQLDPAHRWAAISEIYTEDCISLEADAQCSGRDVIARRAEGSLELAPG
jgi:hypothetical protein